VARASPDVLATVPAGDRIAERHMEEALGCASEEGDPLDPQSSLDRLQWFLFQEESPPPSSPLADEAVQVFSAPGESRECVEIARRIQSEAERGIPYDAMAVLLHSPGEYRRHIEEAFARARIPLYRVGGELAPDPAGRALLALLACAAEDLSARRFSEYLSLGEAPPTDAEGAPPPAQPPAERWVPPDEELVGEAVAAAAGREALQREQQALDEEGEPPRSDPEAQQVRAGTPRPPRHWEQLVNEAAVIGGHGRWQRRLDGLGRDLRSRLKGLGGEDGAIQEALQRKIDELEGLRAFALPLLAELQALPARAPWGEWLERLAALATRALRRPHRVLAVLAELDPMRPVGPVDLAEVRLVLGRRLAEVAMSPPPQRYGAVLVAPTAAARGLAFRVVFVPGLSEKMFPRRILEDPLLPDAQRRLLAAPLAVEDDRVERERLALRLAVGAASERVYLSTSRLDLLHARPRVPSFYGLEVLRAVEGRLPGFAELARRAELSGAARLSWPAPERPGRAIDEAEHDLALLEGVLRRGTEEAAGTLAYLLTTSAVLRRSVLARSQRWSRRWCSADGLVRPSPAARAALDSHALHLRSYSPTALQDYAACPYRFLLRAIHGLAPREVPEPIDEMDALQRGALVHEVQFLLFRELEQRGALPVRKHNLAAARAVLDELVERVAAQRRDEFAPAIERVWEDGVASVRADLGEWLKRMAEEEGDWVPWRFELGFGLPPGHPARGGDQQDPHSRAEPVALEGGVLLRGKIDLLERNQRGELRVTDHKTGRARVEKGAVVAGGQSLQPILYAMAVRQLYGAPVQGGRLHYCTVAGGFEERVVPLTPQTEKLAHRVLRSIQLGLERGFLPAAPQPDGCRWCDYREVCGPYEEQRVRRKDPRALEDLIALRALP
jgi:RecB family exonuclease